MNNLKKTAIATALVASMGVCATASADIVTMTFSGQFTLGNASGAPQVNGDSSDPAGIPGVGSQRTPVTGTATFDTATGAGSASINSFSFFGGGLASATNTTFQAIGNGTGGPGSLVAGQMGFNWNGTNGIPVTLIFDAQGFFANVPAPGTTATIGTGCAGCATSATADASLGGPATIGAVPMAMTNFNTNGTTLGDLFPLVDDGIAGSPMTTSPFPGFHADFDFTSITATNTSGGNPVPVPAAVWLFGSGLMGLVGVARRRKS